MDNQHSRSLIPWAVRSHRIGMIAWGFGMGFGILVTAAAYPAAAKAAGETIKQFGLAAQAIAGSLQFLTGPIQRLDTIAGYVSYKIFPTTTLLLAIYSAIQGAQVLRGAESKGLFDLWFAAGRSRTAIARDRIVSFLITLSVITALLYVGTVVGGVATGESMVVGAIGQCFGVAMVAFFAFAMSLLISQFFITTRTATAATSIFMVASYFIANVSDSLGPLTFVRYLSPFYYYLRERTLVAGIEFNVLAMVALVGSAAVMLGVAWRLNLARDANDVSIRSLEAAKPVDYTFRPTTIWRRNLWLNSIAEQPIALASWGLGIGAFAAVEASLVPSALRLIGDVGGKLKKLLESAGGIGSPDTYLALLMTFTALLVAGFIVFQVSHWVGDASQQRNDAVFTQPVAMSRFVIERMSGLVVMAAVVALCSIGGTWIGSLIGGYSVHVAGLARVFGDTVLFAFGIGGVGLLLATAFRSGAATGVLGLLLVLSYFLDLIVSLFDLPKWVLHASVFNAFSAPGSNAPYLAAPQVGDVVFLFALGAVGAGIAWMLLRRGIRVTA